MSVSLWIAPAAAGKTAYVVDLVREASQGLRAEPRVVVPTGLQRRAFHRRLAEAGGAIGVRVQTFDQLYADLLNAAGEVHTQLSDPVQFRLIRAIVDGLPLVHYAPLRARPGFIQVMRQLIGELKAARVFPEVFSGAVAGMGNEPRLTELAQIYTAYQEQLRDAGWADQAGIAWLAVESLELRAPETARDWPLAVVDGFDSFTPVQMALLEALGKRVGRLVVTLTGVEVPADGVSGSDRKLVHRHFLKTRELLEERLGVRATVLPEARAHLAAPLAHLERNLFCREVAQLAADDVVALVAAPDWAAEVRVGLRWLKARIVTDGMPLSDVALLARDVAPYRPFITQTAREFGLPVRLVDGLPLAANPAIVAVMNLLRLTLPVSEGNSEPALPWRLVVDAWRSPYFDWSALPEEGALEAIGIRPQDANDLDTVARWGRVLRGLPQWEEALAALSGTPEGAGDDVERDIPAQLPRGAAAQALWEKLDRFVQRITPPHGERSYREVAGWIETLIGPDPLLASPRYGAPEEPTSLGVVAQARAAPREIGDRDVAALQALKDILRGLVWAEEALQIGPVPFDRFFDELVGAVQATQYRLPVNPGREELLVANVVQARGVPFRAVVVLGLGEGEFPATIGEDPFLRDGDRARLREEHKLALELSTESSEAGFFYEAITRPREKLLLTRPRLADAGALWQPSPFWEEARRLVDAAPERLTSDNVPSVMQAASWPELMESLSSLGDPTEVREWIGQAAPARQRELRAAVGVLRVRAGDATGSPYDGDLGTMEAEFSQRFGAAHVWSTSRLENHRTCPFLFFVANVLGLEPREEPAEGLEVWQMGNIFHRIFEELYPSVADATDLEILQAALPSVAKAILDEAPRQQGFRETAWWDQTKAEIIETAASSLQALAEIQGEYVPSLFEATFGLSGEPPLVIRDGDDHFTLRGLIDRVDLTSDGRVRIIDYKTSGPSAFTNRAVVDGKKLQIPLYALAASDALGLGDPADGFYWHVRQAKTSPFTLARFRGGPGAAIEVAVAHAWDGVRAARGGYFVPHAPDGGCPPWCPAAGFCWHTRAGYGG